MKKNSCNKQEYKVLATSTLFLGSTIALSTSLPRTQTLKEPEILHSSLVGFEKAHECGFFFLEICHHHSVSGIEMKSVTIKVDKKIIQTKESQKPKLELHSNNALLHATLCFLYIQFSNMH